MSEDYVGRTEFNNLKQEVAEIKDNMKKNASLLVDIDKKVSSIVTKLENANTIEDLKLKPITDKAFDLEKKIEKVEGNQTWLWRSLIVAGIGVVCGIIF